MPITLPVAGTEGRGQFPGGGVEAVLQVRVHHAQGAFPHVWIRIEGQASQQHVGKEQLRFRVLRAAAGAYVSGQNARCFIAVPPIQIRGFARPFQVFRLACLRVEKHEAVGEQAGMLDIRSPHGQRVELARVVVSVAIVEKRVLVVDVDSVDRLDFALDGFRGDVPKQLPIGQVVLHLMARGVDAIPRAVV